MVGEMSDLGECWSWKIVVRKMCELGECWPWEIVVREMSDSGECWSGKKTNQTEVVMESNSAQ